MSDQNSSLPIRTETNGDVVIFLADGITPSQIASVDANGSLSGIIKDASGNAVTTQTNGSQRALDVGVNVGGVQIDPRAIRALTSSDIVTVAQGAAAAVGSAWPILLTDGTNTAAVKAASTSALDTDSSLVVALSPNSPLPTGANVIGAVTQSGGPWTSNLTQVGGSAIAIGQAAMAASLPVVIASNQSAIPVSQSGTWTVQPGNTANTTPWLVTVSTALPAGSNAIGSVLANLQVGSSPVSSSNPVPVTISTTSPGTAIQDYHTSVNVAAGGSVTFTYTVVAAHTFNLERIWASASGKIKVVVQNNGATIFVGFNSTSNPNIDITVISPPTIAAGNTVTVTITNEDKAAMDVYATIEGNQN